MLCMIVKVESYEKKVILKTFVPRYGWIFIFYDCFKTQ